MKRESPDQNGILNYAVVNAELETFIEKIWVLGGKIIVPPTEVPNMWEFLIFLDSEWWTMALWKNSESC
jgi:predicted enzyme related to lactoylglutathione lyase